MTKAWNKLKWVSLGGPNKTDTEDVLRTLHDSDRGSVAAQWPGMRVNATALDEEQHVFSAMASDDSMDRDGEVVVPDGWDLKAYRENPVILWSHNYWDPAIGQSLQEKIVKGEGLKVRGRLSAAEYDFAALIWRLIAVKTLRAISVGFIIDEWEEKSDDYPDADLIFTKQTLLEYSVVNIGANANALIDAERQLGQGIEFMKSLKDWDGQNIGDKGVVTYVAGTADDSVSWDGDAAVASLRSWAGGPDKDDIDWTRYRLGFGWYDADDTENFGAYKLPHHRSADGTFYTVWGGVAAAMGALLGARGGVDVPNEDKRGIYNHLSRHYKQFDKEPPEFDTYTDEEWKAVEAKWDIPDSNSVSVILPPDTEAVEADAPKALLDVDSDDIVLGDTITTEELLEMVEALKALAVAMGIYALPELEAFDEGELDELKIVLSGVRDAIKASNVR